MNAKECPPPSQEKPESPQARPGIPAAELLGSANAVVILHRGERYELRLTRNGKLILTK